VAAKWNEKRAVVTRILAISWLILMSKLVTIDKTVTALHQSASYCGCQLYNLISENAMTLLSRDWRFAAILIR
jgi:hypothetical protein